MINFDLVKQFYAEYNLTQILKLEEELGITKQNFQKKYIFEKVINSN